MVTASSPAYADDSYHLGVGRNKEEAVGKLQLQVVKAEQWMSGSGLKVNLEKTELTIFRRYDTSAAVIKIKDIVVHSSPVLKVLGLLFNNHLQWDKQVEKATTDARRSLKGVRLIKKHFTESENLKLITTMCY